jgi:predicted nucleic acid-binding protein
VNLIIDASVAIKWFVTETLHEEARSLLGRGNDLYAPDLLIAELANAAWKKAKRREIDGRQARKIALACRGDVPALRRSADLVDRALQIAFELGHPVYDCLYLACAEAVGGVLVTADDHLCRVVAGTAFARLIRHVGEFRSAASERNFPLPLTISLTKLEKIIREQERFDKTDKNVQSSLFPGRERDSIENLLSMTPEDLELIFNSPGGRALKSCIDALSDEELSDVLALEWLGEGCSGNDWQEIRKKAREYSRDESDFTKSENVFRLTAYIKNGLAVLRQKR